MLGVLGAALYAAYPFVQNEDNLGAAAKWKAEPLYRHLRLIFQSNIGVHPFQLTPPGTVGSRAEFVWRQGHIVGKGPWGMPKVGRRIKHIWRFFTSEFPMISGSVFGVFR